MSGLPLNSIAFIEFKSEAIAEKMMEEAQGSEIQGRSIMLDFIGEKSRQNKGSQGTRYVLQLLLMCISIGFTSDMDQNDETLTPYVTVMDFLKDSQVLIWSICQLSVFWPYL